MVVGTWKRVHTSPQNFKFALNMIFLIVGENIQSKLGEVN